ncbi:MAG TPA: ABC1 kinase family protein [Ktedonobacterales bacterium]|jgi:predicted unusual protein kinase regulating ubiquinone biosynthesis (AarF/ABC1/UbiB family)|nr:ABC1 kinase family protein [Ktedonobacterales bacterium]
MVWMMNQREAAEQAIADTRAVLTEGLSLRDPVTLGARLGDLARSNGLLALEANLKSLEHYSRVAHVGRQPTRALTFTALAADILGGYLALARRSRLWGRLAQPQDWEWQHERSAARVRDTAARLRGALIKACQFASTRPDILPPAYTRAFATLQDAVPATSWRDIRCAIAQELGRPPEAVFARIERYPIASASIAQVHRAWLRDGRAVAVKVQYPDIAGIMATDLKVLQYIVRGVAEFVPDVQLQPIVDHLKETLPLELDFAREARAMTALRQALRGRDDVLIPAAIPELSTRRLLVMEYVEGVKINDRAGLERAGIDPSALARLINDVYAEQIFRLGWLHADPHPGNLLAQARPGAGPRLVLLDHGLTVPLDPALVAAISEMVSALLQGDFERLTRALQSAGVRLDERLGGATLLQLVGVLLGNEQEGASAAQVGQRLGKSIGHIPTSLILIGRALGLLDGVTKQLDPNLNALEAISGYVAREEEVSA